MQEAYFVSAFKDNAVRAREVWGWAERIEKKCSKNKSLCSPEGCSGTRMTLGIVHN